MAIAISRIARKSIPVHFKLLRGVPIRRSGVIFSAIMRFSHVVKGTRPVTADLALLFGRALRQSPQYWLNLQAAYDLKKAETAIGAQLDAVGALAPA